VQRAVHRDTVRWLPLIDNWIGRSFDAGWEGFDADTGALDADWAT